MNKLTKDQIQKIFLSILLLIGLIYCYFTFLIGPKDKQEAAVSAAIADYDARIADAKSKISHIHAIQDQARMAGETLVQLNELMPEGAPIAWFPPLIRAFFERHSFKNVVTRLENMDAQSDPLMPGFKNASWTIDVPQAKFVPFGIALAGLENEEILLEITRLEITSQPDNLESQHVSFSATTLLK